MNTKVLDIIINKFKKNNIIEVGGVPFIIIDDSIYFADIYTGHFIPLSDRIIEYIEGIYGARLNNDDMVYIYDNLLYNQDYVNDRILDLFRYVIKKENPTLNIGDDILIEPYIKYDFRVYVTSYINNIAGGDREFSREFSISAHQRLTEFYGKIITI